MTRIRGMFQKDLRNRSSKHLRWFTGPGTKDIMRCVSNEMLKSWANREVAGALPELNRRQKKAAKKTKAQQ